MTPQTPTAAPDEAMAIAAEAYVYAYAPLFNYKTLFQQTQDFSFPGYIGGFGKFRHYARGFRPEDTDIVTPSNDTPYSWAWLDLRAEPFVLSVPTIPTRYYVLQWFDMYTHNFAYVGSRATGVEAGNYLFAGPGWDGDAPNGITQDPTRSAAGFHALVAQYGPRVLIGIGVSHAPVVDGAESGRYRRPLARTREFLDALDAAPEPLPVGDRVLAALGPRMLELARDRTGGAHPFLVTPEHTATAREILGAGPLLAPEQGVILETDPATGTRHRPQTHGRLLRAAQLRQQLAPLRVRRRRRHRPRQ